MALPARALTVPSRPSGPINDYAHVLSADAVKRLTDQLLSYEQGTTRQIAVAIFPSLDDEERFDFSMRVAEAWKIGGKKNSDGVLITIFIKEHQDQILVGYGLEGQLTDATSLRIRTELMEPRFKQGDFEGGLREGLAAIDTATGGHEHAEGKLPARSPSAGGGIPVGLIVLAIFVIVIIVSRRGGGRGGGGFWPGVFLGGSSGWSGGSGGWSSGGGGGGWSGGGGSFGGGGSGGSW
ncbi:MAG TPA: TPM domain-containing protein [Polyangia bacterium]